MTNNYTYDIRDEFTYIPSVFFDELLPTLGLAECRVLMYICRQTFGFNRTTAICTIDQISKATKLSRSAAKRALKLFIAKGLIVRTARFATGERAWNLANEYEIKTALTGRGADGK